MLRGKESRKIFLLLLCLCALITACGESPESEEVVVIDSGYLGSTTTTNPPSTTSYPPVAYPIQIEDEVKIKVGELFGYEDFNWQLLFPWEYAISNPEIIEGEGTICAIDSIDVFSVLGISPGFCSVKYPSTNAGEEGFIFLTIKVVEG
tara:strand:+ start:117 stop:563 length:447 start_codon:yes stop_codon:yes gene_type:complete